MPVALFCAKVIVRCKLLLCLEMLQERRLIALLGGEQRKTAELLPTQGKVDIFASPVYGRAKQLVKN